MAKKLKMKRPGSSSEGRPQDRWRFKLYVAGLNGKSLVALTNLKRICVERLAGNYEVEVVDLLKKPALAKSDEIVAIPTLVRAAPEPMRRVLGDLSNTERVLSGLALGPQ